MRRRVEALKPYTFESDFTPPSPDAEGKIELTTADLAALLAETREATAALVRDETLKAQAEHLQTVSADLKEALSAIVNLAGLLEKASIDEHDRQMALHNIQHLARTLIDGQGELFTKASPHSSVGNHSD